MTISTSSTTSTEQQELLETLSKHRAFLRYTVRDLTDEQAAARTTVSELCLGGLIKHVAEVESRWVQFIVEGPSVFPSMNSEWNEAAIAAYHSGFQMLPGETLAGLLDRYEQTEHRTTDVVHGLASLDVGYPLPEAPWFEKGAHWSARRTLLHVIAETAQHAGHADIVREALDGQKTMG